MSLTVPDNHFSKSNSIFIPRTIEGIQLVGFNQQKPSSAFSDSDIGARYSTFIEGWNITSFLYKQMFDNETWELNLLTSYGFDQNDYSIQLELRHMFENNLKIWLGTGYFAANTEGLFGQFDEIDRFKFGFEWGL